MTAFSRGDVLQLNLAAVLQEHAARLRILNASVEGTAFPEWVNIEADLFCDGVGSTDPDAIVGEKAVAFDSNDGIEGGDLVLAQIVATITGDPGSGENYTVDVPEGNAGFGICTQASTGTIYPVSVIEGPHGGLGFLVPGTDPDTGRPTTNLISPTYPFAFAEGDVVFSGISFSLTRTPF